MKPEILIFPDIHGRKFWKPALKKFPISKYPNLKIIFLGDYLDPYSSYEGISSSDAFSNFKDILKAANKDPRIIMLIGNHDWHYFVNLDTCRLDFSREHNIAKLFKNNMSKFRLTYSAEVNGCKYLFSHAGITSGWINDIANLAKDEIANWNPGEGDNYVNPEEDERYIWINKLSNITQTYDFELFEECLQNYEDSFYTCPISMISGERGGWDRHGSLIWADVHEHLCEDDISGIYQIFGHTINYPNYNTKDYAISPNGKNIAMIDASCAFILDNEGHIEPVY